MSLLYQVAHEPRVRRESRRHARRSCNAGVTSTTTVTLALPSSTGSPLRWNRRGWVSCQAGRAPRAGKKGGLLSIQDVETATWTSRASRPVLGGEARTPGWCARAAGEREPVGQPARVAFDRSSRYRPTVIPHAFHSRPRAPPGAELRRDRLLLATATAAIMIGLSSDVNAAFALGVPTCALGIVWAALLRWRRTVGKRKLRLGWVASIPLALVNGALGGALVAGIEWGGWRNYVFGAVVGATVGAVF